MRHNVAVTSNPGTIRKLLRYLETRYHLRVDSEQAFLTTIQEAARSIPVILKVEDNWLTAWLRK